MIAQFQIIFEVVTPLKIQCIDKFPDDIEGFEPHYYDLYDVEQHYQPDGSTAYKGILQVTYLSIERDLYIFRY